MSNQEIIPPDRPAHLWKKGQSGNKNGRPKKTPEFLEVERLCRECSVEAIERLKAWIRSDHPQASPQACKILLERAYGKPRQYIEAEVRQEQKRMLDVTALSWEQREQLEQVLLTAKAKADG